jgi:hypothetical protein
MTDDAPAGFCTNRPTKQFPQGACAAKAGKIPWSFQASCEQVQALLAGAGGEECGEHDSTENVAVGTGCMRVRNRTADLSADDIRANLQGEYTLVWARPTSGTMVQSSDPAKGAKGCMKIGFTECGDEGCECERVSNAEAKARGWVSSKPGGFEWGEYARWPNGEHNEFSGFRVAEGQMSFNFETGIWTNGEGVKFKNGLRVE